MKKEVAEKLFNEKGIVYIPFYKKIWYSITKFEKYADMATEGVGRAISYFICLILLFSMIFSLVLCIRTSSVINEIEDYLNSNINNISYEDGILNIDVNNDAKEIATSVGTVIIDTYEDEEINYTGDVIVFQDDGVLYNLRGYKDKMYYDEIIDEDFSFNKSDFISFIDTIFSGPQLFAAFLLVIFGYLFFVILIDILILTVFGIFASLMAGLRIRYRAIFNMAIYSITTSTILQLIYYIINCFTQFNIKYFDFMYIAISFICLIAAIFMIKSDVLKQRLELMKVMQENGWTEDHVIGKETKKDEDKEEKKEKDEKDEKEEKDEDEKKEKGSVDGQQSNA